MTGGLLASSVGRGGPCTGRDACYALVMADREPPRLRRRTVVPILGATVGAAAGFAYYWFFGCDSG